MPPLPSLFLPTTQAKKEDGNPKITFLCIEKREWGLRENKRNLYLQTVQKEAILKFCSIRNSRVTEKIVILLLLLLF